MTPTFDSWPESGSWPGSRPGPWPESGSWPRPGPTKEYNIVSAVFRSCHIFLFSSQKHIINSSPPLFDDIKAEWKFAATQTNSKTIEMFSNPHFDFPARVRSSSSSCNEPGVGASQPLCTRNGRVDLHWKSTLHAYTISLSKVFQIHLTSLLTFNMCICEDSLGVSGTSEKGVYCT